MDTINILLVDDDEGLLDQAKHVLEKDDDPLEVIPVPSGEKALEYIKNDGADIVVADYKMPAMDGLDLLKKLRENGDDIPFILFTGKGREEIAMKALNLGADRYFKKGGDPMAQYDILGQAVKQEVNHHRTQHEREEMRARLEEREKKYEALFNSLDVPMVMLDEDNFIEIANPKFQELSGYERGEIEGKKDWIQFVEEEQREEVKKFHDLRNIDESLVSKTYEFDFIDKFDNSKKVFASLVGISGVDGCLLSLMEFTDYEDPMKELKKIFEVVETGMMPDSKEISTAVRDFFGEEEVTSFIKDWCLDEVLILLIQKRDGASGKQLMSALNDYLDVDLSSSIVYPRLHEMEDQDVLKVQEHIRTKEYIIQDEENADEKVSDKLQKLFGVYYVLKTLKSLRSE